MARDTEFNANRIREKLSRIVNEETIFYNTKRERDGIIEKPVKISKRKPKPITEIQAERQVIFEKYSGMAMEILKSKGILLTKDVVLIYKTHRPEIKYHFDIANNLLVKMLAKNMIVNVETGVYKLKNKQ